MDTELYYKIKGENHGPDCDGMDKKCLATADDELRNQIGDVVFTYKLTSDYDDYYSAYIYVTGFSFVVDGAKVSHTFKEPVFCAEFKEDICDSVNMTEFDYVAVAIAMFQACGPINYGEDIYVRDIMTPAPVPTLSSLIPAVCGQQ